MKKIIRSKMFQGSKTSTTKIKNVKILKQKIVFFVCFCIGATIRTHQENQCLLYEGFFYDKNKH